MTNKANRRRIESVYIACEDINFVWRQDEVDTFDYLWCNETTDITELSEKLGRKPVDVAMLIIDRAHTHHIGPHGAKGKAYTNPQPRMRTKGVSVRLTRYSERIKADYLAGKSIEQIAISYKIPKAPLRRYIETDNKRFAE